MAQKTDDVATARTSNLTRREPTRVANAFGALERLADEMDRVFDDFGLGRSWLAPRWNRNWPGASLRGADLWAPQIEVHQRNNEIVVRADLPGMKKEDVSIEVTDNDITISGERRQEEESERGGIYRSERSYGSFCRTIPLPDGAMTDQARATFTNGVLEIAMPAPPPETRGRRLEIREGNEPKK
jgi:HSP20 family protein